MPKNVAKHYIININDENVKFQEVPVQTPHHQCNPETPLTTEQQTPFTPSVIPKDFDLSIPSQSEEDTLPSSTPKDKLNCFLAARDVSPVRSVMKIPWDEAAGRTKRHYLRKARQVVFATLEEIAPNNSDSLLRAVKERQLNDDGGTDYFLLEALAECYENASHWSSRRQILSIFADKVNFRTIQQWIPNITRYRYSIARHHLMLHGRGVQRTPEKRARIKVPLEKLNHFLEFITSARVVQDLPFGEKTLKLSSAEIKIPNVVRTSIPEQIVKQYQSYCMETGFSLPLSRSSLCRILKVCSASTRTSLEGLDYFSAEGAKAFDELIGVVDKLGDEYELGVSWSKEQIRKLKMAKRYLKSDYKVSDFLKIFPPSLT